MDDLKIKENYDDINEILNKSLKKVDPKILETIELIEKMNNSNLPKFTVSNSYSGTSN